MIDISPFRSAAALSATLLAVAIAAPAVGQSASGDLAECQRLYSQWSRYNGTSAYGKMLTADAALEECRKGNVTAGIADLKRVLERSNIPLPPSETATAR